MRVKSSTKLPEYQVIGPTLRIHWNYEEVPETEDTPAGWSCDEAAIPKTASRGQIIEAIIATKYPTTGAELAAVNNGGQEYDDYQAFRATAKSLADGWFK
jgi:hypothetical protein